MLHRTLRILLCGLVAGVVWFVSSAALLVLFAPEFLEAARGAAVHPARGGLYFLVIDLAMGVWALWLHDRGDARHRSPVVRVASTAAAWWSMKTLQSAKWLGLGLLPAGSVAMPLLTSAFAVLLATAIGGWLYSNTAPRNHAVAPVVV